MIGKIILGKERIRVKLGFGCWQVRLVSCCSKYRLLMGLGVMPQQEHITIYILIYVWKQYFQPLN